jgi:hypothetical protein
MIYLSGGVNPAIRHAAQRYPLGVMCTPAKAYRAQIAHFRWWAADNGCYAQGEQFNLAAYLAWLETYSAHRHTCLFAPAPDVVGDAPATLARSQPVLPIIRRLGFPAALVAQDGLEALPVPWRDVDALFIGGTTDWKLSPGAAALAREAKARGKWVHMGRVNSGRRLMIAQSVGCDSVDGNQLIYQPKKYLPRLMRFLGALEWQFDLWGDEVTETTQ